MANENELAREIEIVAKQEKRFGWINYIVAYFVATLALAGSIAASILAAASQVDKWITAVVAVIPAAVFALTRIFNFERRAWAHWTKANKLHGLLRKLRYEGVDEKEASQEFTRIELETPDDWIMFGSLVEGVQGRAALSEEAKRQNE